MHYSDYMDTDDEDTSSEEDKKNHVVSCLSTLHKQVDTSLSKNQVLIS